MFNDFEKIRVFSNKPIYFFKKKTSFVGYEKSYYISRILQKICYNLVIQKIQRQNSGTFEHYQFANGL